MQKDAVFKYAKFLLCHIADGESCALNQCSAPSARKKCNFLFVHRLLSGPSLVDTSTTQNFGGVAYATGMLLYYLNILVKMAIVLQSTARAKFAGLNL